jgi:hypothetical protein
MEYIDQIFISFVDSIRKIIKHEEELTVLIMNNCIWDRFSHDRMSISDSEYCQE